MDLKRWFNSWWRGDLQDFFRMKLLLVLIYLALECYYYFFITVDFAYMGFVLNVSVMKYMLTKLFLAMFFVFSHHLFKRSAFLYSVFLLLLFFFYFPNAILYSLSDGPFGPFISNVFFISVFTITPHIRFAIPQFRFDQRTKVIVLLALPVLVFIPIALTFMGDINLKTLMLKDIQEARAGFSEKSKGYIGYLYHMEVKTLIPLAFVFFLSIKKRWVVATLTIAILYLYVISGNRIVYFTTFILLFFYFVGRTYVNKSSWFFRMVLLFLLVAFAIDKLVFNTPILGGTFVNRFLFIPALLNKWYFEFFDGNPFFFAESHLFKSFVHNPYDMLVGYLLCEVYWGEATAYANNGIVSDGFMNLGYFGVVLFSFLFALIFSLFNSLKLNKAYFGIFFSYVYMLLSVPFLSSFISGGILLFIMIAVLLLRNNNESALGS